MHDLQAMQTILYFTAGVPQSTWRRDCSSENGNNAFLAERDEQATAHMHGAGPMMRMPLLAGCEASMHMDTDICSSYQMYVSCLETNMARRAGIRIASPELWSCWTRSAM